MLNSGKMTTWMVTVFTCSSPQTWATSVRLSLGLNERKLSKSLRFQECVDQRFAPLQRDCEGSFFREFKKVLENLLVHKCCEDRIQKILEMLPAPESIPEVS